MQGHRANTHTAEWGLEILSLNFLFRYPMASIVRWSELGALYSRCAFVFLQCLLYDVVIICESQVRNCILFLQASSATYLARLTINNSWNRERKKEPCKFTPLEYHNTIPYFQSFLSKTTSSTFLFYASNLAFAWSLANCSILITCLVEKFWKLIHSKVLVIDKVWWNTPFGDLCISTKNSVLT